VCVCVSVRVCVWRDWGDDGQRAWFSYFWKPDFSAAAAAAAQRTACDPTTRIIIIIIIIIKLGTIM